MASGAAPAVGHALASSAEAGPASASSPGHLSLSPSVVETLAAAAAAVLLHSSFALVSAFSVVPRVLASSAAAALVSAAAAAVAAVFQSAAHIPPAASVVAEAAPGSLSAAAARAAAVLSAFAALAAAARTAAVASSAALTTLYLLLFPSPYLLAVLVDLVWWLHFDTECPVCSKGTLECLIEGHQRTGGDQCSVPGAHPLESPPGAGLPSVGAAARGTPVHQLGRE